MKRAYLYNGEELLFAEARLAVHTHAIAQQDVPARGVYCVTDENSVQLKRHLGSDLPLMVGAAMWRL